MNNKGLSPLVVDVVYKAYVYNGVSLTTDPLVVGNGSYIVPALWP